MTGDAAKVERVFKINLASFMDQTGKFLDEDT